MRRLPRSVTGLAVACAAVLAGSALAGCGSSGYIYASDTHDKAFFKVPADWHQVDPRFVAQVQATLLSRSAAGAAGGAVAWSRVYTTALHPSALSLLTGSGQPTVYASVQDLRDSLRAQLSFDLMRNLLFPVTASARQADTAAGEKLPPGFVLLLNATISTKSGMRGINELYEFDISGKATAFDQTVLTNSSTTKLYLLLVQCDQDCFLAHKTQIAAVVHSFTVEGP
jgi:hypothetical protein